MFTARHCYLYNFKKEPYYKWVIFIIMNAYFV